MVQLREPKSEVELEELLKPRKVRSGLFGKKMRTRSDETEKLHNKSKSKWSSRPSSRDGKGKKEKDRDVLPEVGYEIPTPPISPDSSDSSPVGNISVKFHHKVAAALSSQDNNGDTGSDGGDEADEEVTIFSDITDNRTYRNSPKRGGADKDGNNNEDKDNKQKVSTKQDPPDDLYADPVEAMKARMRNSRHTGGACCGSEDTDTIVNHEESSTTMMSTILNAVSCTTSGTSVAALTYDGTMSVEVDSCAHDAVLANENSKNQSKNSKRRMKKKMLKKQQQQQQQQKQKDVGSLRKVLSFTPMWGMAPGMDEDEELSLSPSLPTVGDGSNTNTWQTQSKSTLPDSPKSASMQDDGFEFALEDYDFADKNDDGNGKDTAKRGWRSLFKKHKAEAAEKMDAISAFTPPQEFPARRLLTPPKPAKSKGATTKTAPSPPRKKEVASAREIPYQRVKDEKQVEKKRKDEDHATKQRRLASSMQDELEAARAVARHKKKGKKAGKEARYKYLLTSFKGSPGKKSLLETVVESEGDERSLPSEYTEMKVRVPGIEQPDAFLMSSDLVGAEFVEEKDEDYDSDDNESEDEVEDEQPVPAQFLPEYKVERPVTEPAVETKAIVKETKAKQPVVEPVVVVEEDAEEIVTSEKTQKLWLAQIKKVPELSSEEKKILWLERVQKIAKVPGKAAVSTTESKHVQLEVPENNPNPFKKSTSMPPAESDTLIQRTRSWYDRLGLKRVASLVEDDCRSGGDESSLGRNRSAPLDTRKKLSKSNKPKPKEKPVWKGVVDESSGNTYYYHRITRTTTWTKPADMYEPTPPEDEEDDIEIGEQSGKNQKEKNLAEKRKEIMAALRKQTTRDFDPEVWNTKSEIVGILTTMAPPDGDSVERLMKSYEGNEKELLTNLRDLSESRPFDEPIRNVSTSSPDAVVKFDDMSHGKQSFDKRSTSFVSNFSHPTMISEQTEVIRNTAGGITIANRDSSVATDGSISDGRGVGAPEYHSYHARVPSKIPVPRSRELHVEEFTTNERVKAETYTVNNVVRNTRKTYQEETVQEEEPSFLSLFDLSPYLGENDDTTDVDTAADTVTDTATDTASIPTVISGLSETDNDEFGPRKEEFDHSKRRALDEAIAKEDWDLAAAVSEGLRTRSQSSNKSSPSRKPKEWTQSELDKFISENDWDAVASYIAHVRDSAKATEDSPPRNEPVAPAATPKKLIGPKDGSNPKKRFGALSQLQHDHINSDSSWDSSAASSYYSDDTSSASYYSDEDPAYAASNAKRLAAKKEFAC